MTQNLLTHRGFWRWLAGGQAARLPDLMAPLALTAATAVALGSAAAGGAMVTALVVAEVTFGVSVGRWMDRVGVPRSARILLLARGLAYLGLLAAILARLPLPALVAIAAIPGALGAGIAGGFRALLSGVVPESMLSRAVSVNSMAIDGTIIAGPLLVAALSTFSVSGPLVAVAALSVLAVGLVPGSPGAGVRQDSAGGRPGRSRGRLARPLVGWAVSAFALGHVCSTVEVAALPVAQRLGAGPGSAALLIAVFSVASIVGSVLYTVRKSTGTVGMAVALLITMAAGAALTAWAPGWSLVLAGMVVAGVCVGPLVTINSLQAERCMPADRRAEGFAVLNTAQGLGFAAGSLTLSLLPLMAMGLLASTSAFVAAAVLASARTRVPKSAVTSREPELLGPPSS